MNLHLKKLVESPEVRASFYMWREGLRDNHDLSSEIERVDIGWTWEQIGECEDVNLQMKIVECLNNGGDSDIADYLSNSLIKNIGKDLAKAIKDQEDESKLDRMLEEL